MRCYMMRRGSIVSCEFLDAGPDESLVEQARKLFLARKSERFDAFEVWDRARRVHRQPPAAERTMKDQSNPILDA